MTFERTQDLDLVRAILTDPAIWPHIGDDFAPRQEAFWPNSDERIFYAITFARHLVAGLFVFIPESPVCWEAHVAMLPEWWGKVAHQAGREIVPWVWANTTCERLIARVPETNPAAVLYGLRAMGLKKFGVNSKSFLKGGTLRDQILMGISRPPEVEPSRL
jgi:RimJ/RimL family protein N-acetyltransferase